MPEITRLSAAECDTLLRAGTFGRVALGADRRPEILPVNYRVVDDAIWIRTDPDGLLARAAASGVPVAFEVDLVDHERWRGWSAVAHGTAELVPDAEAHEPLAGRPAPRPWADGDRSAHVRIRWSELSGRKVGRGWDAHRAMPFRPAAAAPDEEDT